MVELQKIRFEDVNVGDEIPSFEHTFQKMDAIIYAGASGDFNPIHVDPDIAKLSGQPNVFAHGLFNMALLGKVIVDWIGDPGLLKKFSVQFRGRVFPGDTVTFKGRVREKLEGNLVVLDVWAVKQDGTEALKNGEAVVHLP
jgi:acyl dehydratase